MMPPTIQALIAEFRAHRVYFWLGAALLVGLFTRFWNLTLHSLYIDEGFTFLVGSKPVGPLLQFVAHYDFHPPGFYLATHVLMQWLHWQPWNYRFFTAAFGLVTIVATWAIARREFGVLAAGIAALVVALEPGLVQYDRLYRMYAVLVGLSTLSWWLLLSARDAKGRRRWAWWSAYGLCALALPYVHYLGAVTLLAQGVYAITRVRRLWPALVACAAAAAALIPWLWAIRIQLPNGGQVVRLSHATYLATSGVRYTLGEGMPVGWQRIPHFDLAFFVVVCALLVAAVWLGRKSVLPFWLLPAVLQFVATYALHRDLAIPRYLYSSVPAFAASVGAVAAALFVTRARVAGLALVLTVVTLGVIEVENVLFVPLYKFPDWYAVSVLLAAKAEHRDLLVIVQGSPYWVVHSLRGFRGHAGRYPTIPSDTEPTIRWLAAHPRRRIWYIENQPYYPDPHKRILAFLRNTRKVLGNWIEYRVSIDDQVYVALYGPVALPSRTKSVVKTKSP